MKWSRINKSIRATAPRRWAVRFLLGLALVALLADFLANDRPIAAGYGGEWRFPVFRQLLEPLTGPRPYGDLPGRSWQRAETDWAIWPLVPYKGSEIDLANANYKGPFDAQRTENWHQRHWLGTDRNGRDLLAGLIRGSRVALLVGLISMSLALVIGLTLGGLAGYFYNDRLRTPRWKGWGLALGMVLAGVYLVGAGWAYGNLLGIVILPLLAGLLVWGLFWVLARGWIYLRHTVTVPIDTGVMRLIEVFNSLPTLVILIAILPAIDSPTIFTVMVVIGLIRWTGIARFVRAELLRIRNLHYVQAARLSGFSHGYVLLRHALPNALGPVVVALSFGVAGAILLEAYLSFLSIGLAPDQVSWGSLLRQSRDQPAAWWLAVFPGLAIFLTVLCLNVVGEALRGE